MDEVIYKKFQTASPDRYGMLRLSAHENKRKPTLAERLLWERLRRRTLGFQFRRQHIIGDYIADFVCIEKSLVVEVDGDYHNSPEQREYDVIRTRQLEQQGFRVIRFTNDEVIHSIEYVLNTITHNLQHDIQE